MGVLFYTCIFGVFFNAQQGISPFFKQYRSDVNRLKKIRLYVTESRIDTPKKQPSFEVRHVKMLIGFPN